MAEEQLATELKQEVKQETKASVNEAVHITIEEKLNLEMSRDGAVRTSELTGVVMINIEEEQFAKVKFLVECDDAEHVQIQVGTLVGMVGIEATNTNSSSESSQRGQGIVQAARTDCIARQVLSRQVERWCAEVSSNFTFG